MMIKETTLMSNRYKYKHIDIKVLKKNSNENVIAFSATFVHVGMNGKLSDGHIEINKTLWDQQSSKRPPGFLVYRNVEKDDGTTTTVMVSEEWLFEVATKDAKIAFKQMLDEEVGMSDLERL
ncbi:hypothetical protein [Bacillus thuringiensis]|uniref:hypothetical protein n=1 Tax=Bacillus thuringiensis TaxID=1428 RepID=UPI000BFA6F30|nr:hypothetical protein [Bacillus thuringiensis]PES56072.1 hypothetical protein CN499_06505 [Bacillus thuringiensis]